MLWRRSARPLVIPAVAPVPDAETLRRAALQASWQRGRWVARRRVAVRWLLWVAARYLMPALAVSGIAAWLWLSDLPGLDEFSQRFAWGQQPSTAAVSAPTPAAQQPSPSGAVAVEDPPDTSEPAAEFSPEGEELPAPLALTLESRWASAPPVPPGSPAQPGIETDRESIPSLKPENWLHSKEP